MHLVVVSETDGHRKGSEVEVGAMLMALRAFSAEKHKAIESQRC